MDVDDLPVSADRLEHHGFCAKQGERLCVLLYVNFAFTADPDQVAAVFGRAMQQPDVGVFQKFRVAGCMVGQVLLPVAFSTATFKDQDLGIEQELDRFEVARLECSAEAIHRFEGCLHFGRFLLGRALNGRSSVM